MNASEQGVAGRGRRLWSAAVPCRFGLVSAPRRECRTVPSFETEGAGQSGMGLPHSKAFGPVPLPAARSDTWLAPWETGRGCGSLRRLRHLFRGAHSTSHPRKVTVDVGRYLR